MNKLNKILLAMVVSVGLVSPAVAGHPRQDPVYDYARVVDVQPLMKTVRVEQPHKECWTEHETQTHYQKPKRKSYTPEIFGALVGAAIGREFGHGRGRDVGAVAGAVLGGSIARDAKHQNHRDRHTTTSSVPVERCEVQSEYYDEERITGYLVKYKYRGNIYSTRMDQDPGDRIRVRVNVTPVAS